MIQDKAKKKAEIVSFFEKYGLDATITAFKYSKSSIYSWRKTLRESHGNIKSLNEGDKTPHHPRESKIDQRIKDFIQDYRWEHPRAGKEKLSPDLDAFCKREGIAAISESTIGGVISELKQKDKIPKKFKVFLIAKTGRVVIRDLKLKKKKLRRKGYQPESPGDLLQLDTFNQKLTDWLLWYNTRRPHSSLNNQNPVQYLIENLGFSRMLWTYAKI